MNVELGEVERERWKKIIIDHKECVCMIFCFPFSEDSHFYEQARDLTLALHPCLPP